MILPDNSFTTNFTNSSMENDDWINIIGGTVWTVTTLLTLLLNSVCLILLHHVQGFKKPTIIFLKSMTISDLILGLLFYLPMVIVFISKRNWPLGEVFCNLEAWVIRQGLPTSAFSALLVTTDRYIAIAHPLHYEEWLSPKRARIIVCFVWFTTNLYALVSMLTTENQKAKYNEYFFICTFGSIQTKKAVILLVTLSMGILLIITVMYIRILVIAQRHAAHIATHRPSINGAIHPPIPSINRKSFTTVFIITMTLIIGWMPSVAIGLTNTTDPFGLVIILTQLPLASVSWLNVIVYYVRNQAFKQAGQDLLARTLKYCKGCCPQV